MKIVVRSFALSAVLFTSTHLAFAQVPGMPAGGLSVPKAPEMPKIGCGVAAPDYIVLLPGAGAILSTTVTLENARTQLYRSSICMVAAQRDLMIALDLKELGEAWSAKVTNLSGTSFNAESQAALLVAASDPALNEALTAAAANVGAVSDEQKKAIRAADLKRLSAALALGTLAVDLGRMVVDIGMIVKKVQDEDPTLLEELLKNRIGIETIVLWPDQVKGIVASAKSFGSAAKETGKVVKVIYKKAKIDPPKAAEIQESLAASGDE